MTRRAVRAPVLPSHEELDKARSLFAEYEPRDLFYRAATELVALAFEHRTSLTVAEAIAVLLQTWNREYYRFHPFDSKHFEAIDDALTSGQRAILSFRPRTIMSLTTADFDSIANLFEPFDSALAPVGAAKAVHLLAPDFFPLWDRKIAQAYAISLDRAGLNAAEYIRFMTITLSQIKPLASTTSCTGLLKRIDEYNYCKYTKGWL